MCWLLGRKMFEWLWSYNQKNTNSTYPRIVYTAYPGQGRRDDVIRQSNLRTTIELRRDNVASLRQWRDVLSQDSSNSGLDQRRQSIILYLDHNWYIADTNICLISTNNGSALNCLFLFTESAVTIFSSLFQTINVFTKYY